MIPLREYPGVPGYPDRAVPSYETVSLALARCGHRTTLDHAVAEEAFALANGKDAHTGGRNQCPTVTEISRCVADARLLYAQEITLALRDCHKSAGESARIEAADVLGFRRRAMVKALAQVLWAKGIVL